MSEYPLSENAADRLHTATGRRLNEITLEGVLDGSVTMNDLRVSADALERQAEIADQANRPQLAENFRRAAELVAVPEEKVLRIYDALRPGRTTSDELLRLADELETTFSAHRCAAFVREALQDAAPTDSVGRK